MPAALSRAGYEVQTRRLPTAGLRTKQLDTAAALEREGLRARTASWNRHQLRIAAQPRFRVYTRRSEESETDRSYVSTETDFSYEPVRETLSQLKQQRKRAAKYYNSEGRFSPEPEPSARQQHFGRWETGRPMTVREYKYLQKQPGAHHHRPRGISNMNACTVTPTPAHAAFISA